MTIGKRVFSIEEDAYGDLQKYLDDITLYFNKEDTSGEIIEDIEDSISEKLSAQSKNLKNAVTKKDVQAIIWELWTIEELSSENEEESVHIQEKSTEKRQIRRLYRNGEDKVLGGVASGIANYFQIDPVIPRILFVLVFFANGFGLLAYIVLWIVVPIATTASQKLSMMWEETNLESIERFSLKDSLKKVPEGLMRNILSLPIRIIELFVGFLMKIFPLVRMFFGIVTIFISSVFIFVISTIFLSLVTGGGSITMDSVTREAFTKILEIDNYGFSVIALFALTFIPFFLVLLGWFYLLLKRKVIGLSVSILLFILWIFSASFLVIQIVSNIDTIENVAEIFWEEIIDGEHRELRISIWDSIGE